MMKLEDKCLVDPQRAVSARRLSKRSSLVLSRIIQIYPEAQPTQLICCSLRHQIAGVEPGSHISKLLPLGSEESRKALQIPIKFVQYTYLDEAVHT